MFSNTAPKPPWTGLGSRLESMCRKALYQFKLLEESQGKIAVALSGGKDSLALLCLLKAISGRGFPDLSITAIHVAGAFSCGPAIDGGILQTLCQDLEIPLVVTQSHQKLNQLECYSCSRERRRLIFEAAKERGIQVIAFGHHKDDFIETLMMNLLHKAEFCSNLAKIHMHDYGITIIRPLLFIREQELREFAKLYGLTRIVCQCPVGQDSNRKRIKELIGLLEQTFPNTRENLFQAGLEYGSQKALKK